MRNMSKDFQHYFRPSQEVQILQLLSRKSPMSFERKLPHLTFGESEQEDEPSVEFACSRSLDRERQSHKSCHGRMIEELAMEASLGKNAFGKINGTMDSMDELQPRVRGKHSCVSSDDNINQANQIEAFSFHCESSDHPPSEDHIFSSKDSVAAVEEGLEEKGWRAYIAMASDCDERHSESGNSDDNFSSSLGSDHTSDDDDGSVASKILGLGSTCNSTLGATARGRSNENFYQKSLKIRGVKLKNCTEELGSESSDVQEEGTPGEHLTERVSKMNDGGQDSREKAGLQEDAGFGYGLVEAEGDAENGYIEDRICASVDLEPMSDMLHKPKYTGKFPPPLSPITMTGNPNCPTNSCLVYLRPYRKDGRFVLREVRIPRLDYLRASRKDGRLILERVRHSDGRDHDNEKSAVFGEGNFGNRVPEEFHCQEEKGVKEREREWRSGSLEEEDYSPKTETESNVFDGKGNTSTEVAIGSQAAKGVREQENELETREEVARKEYSSRVEEFCSTMGTYAKTINFNHSEENCSYQDENLQVSFLREELSCCRMHFDDVSRRFLPNQPLLSADQEGRQESGFLNAIASDLSKFLNSFGLEVGNGKCFAGQLKEDFSGNTWKHFEGARSLPATISHDLQATLAQMRAAICEFEVVQNISCRERLDRAERKNCSTYWELHCVATSS